MALPRSITRWLSMIAFVFLFIASLSIAQSMTNEDKLKEANNLVDRANILHNNGRYDQAAPLLEKALRLRTETLGEMHTDTITNIDKLAETYGVLGRHAEALPLREKVLRLTIETRGEQHPNVLIGLNNLAVTYKALGRHAEALPLQEKIVRLTTEMLGQKHPFTLASLNNLARTYNALGRHTDALPLQEKVLRLTTETQGEKHLSTLASLINLTLTYLELGRPADALPLQEKILKLRTETLGAKHPDTLISLDNVAATYKALGRSTEALALNEKALRLRIETLGEKHPDTLNNFINLAQTYNALGQFAKELPLWEKILRLTTETLGEKNHNTLSSLNNLALAYGNLSHHTEALPLHERTLRLRTEVLGEKHPDTLNSLSNLAETYFRLGRNAEALPLWEKALRLTAETLGEKHPDTLRSLNNLAYTYDAVGRPAEALPLHERTLRLRTEVLGEKHPDTLSSLNNLAETYFRLGRNTEAVILHKKALRLYTETLGERHPSTLLSLNNLAGTYADIGRPAEALSLHERTLRLRTEALGEKHPDTLTSLNNLALTYGSLGRYVEALPLHEKALKLHTKVLGEKHPHTLGSIYNLAIIYSRLGRSTEALSLHKKALQLYTETLGPNHPDTLRSLRNVALEYVDLNRPTEALPLFERLVTGVEQLRASGELSPANRLALFAQWVEAYKRYAELLVAQGNIARGFDLSELSKARTLLESTAARRANEAGILSPAEQAQVREIEVRLSWLDEKIAGAFNRPEAKLNLETSKNELVREYAGLRRQLIAKYPKYAQLNDVNILTAEDGKALVPADTVLISYLLSGDRPLAFTLSARDGLRAYALDKIPGLDKTLDAYRQLVSDPLGAKGLAQDGLTVSKLPDRTFVVMATGKVPAAAVSVRDAAELGRELAEKLLKPILPAIAGYRHWIVSPDGALSMLPFEALPLDGKPVVATHDVSYVQSLSMLALLKQREQDYRNLAGRKALFAMGGAPYESGAPAADTRGRKTRRSPSRPAVNVNAMLNRSHGDAGGVQRAFEALELRWTNLPGTEAEVDNVARIFGTPQSAVYKKQEATEAKLLELNRRRELTGYRYFLFSAHGYLSTEEPALSALVLSQVNKAAGTDGYVTASEWPGYDLKSDLMVLSACDTGVGKVVQGEGVMGLPYALYVAGNKNTLLSLWPVVDESTALFMTSFFTKLKSGIPQAQALNDTKREFLQHPQFNKPAFWAPFVMYGIN